MPADLAVFYGLVKPEADREWLAWEQAVTDLYKGGDDGGFDWLEGIKQVLSRNLRRLLRRYHCL